MKNTGGHVYPTPEYYDEKQIGMYDGISVRDYFAIRLAAGWLTSFDGETPHPCAVLSTEDTPASIEAAEQRAAKRIAALARMSYELADAMIAERSK